MLNRSHLAFLFAAMAPSACLAADSVDSTSRAVLVTALIFFGILILISDKLRTVIVWLVVKPFISFGKAHVSLARHLLPKDVVFPDVAKRSATDQTP